MMNSWLLNEWSWLTDWRSEVDWLTEWVKLTDWLNELVDWMNEIDWQTEWMSELDWLTYWLTDLPYILAYKTSFWDQKMRLKQGGRLIWENKNVWKSMDIKLLIWGQILGVVLYVRSPHRRVYMVLTDWLTYLLNEWTWLTGWMSELD